MFDQKNEEHFKKLFNKYIDKATKAALRFTDNRHQAEDIVSESFLELWKSDKMFETEEKAAGYVFVTVKNKSINYCDHIARRRRRMLCFNGQINEPAPSCEKIPSDYVDYYIRKTNNLSEAEKSVAYLHLNNLQPLQIAKKTGIPYGSLWELRRRFIKKIKYTLKKSVKTIWE